MNPVIDPWIRFVHENAVEVAVTLLVSGRLVTGMLVPTQRYERWEREVLKRTELAGGRFELPSLELPPMSKEDVAETRTRWPDIEQELYPDHAQEEGFAYLCLRNARIYDVMNRSSIPLPFLLLSVHAVAALMPGLVQPGNEVSSETPDAGKPRADS
jgi:hypothetical protein